MENLDTLSFLKGAYLQMERINKFLPESKKKEFQRNKVEEKKLKRWLEILSTSDFNYEIFHGTTILVVVRPNQIYVKPEEKGKASMCLFCGDNHKHGIGEGHRVPDCKSSVILDKIQHKDGTILYQKDGYILREEIKE